MWHKWSIFNTGETVPSNPFERVCLHLPQNRNSCNNSCSLQGYCHSRLVVIASQWHCRTVSRLSNRSAQRMKDFSYHSIYSYPRRDPNKTFPKARECNRDSTYYDSINWHDLLQLVWKNPGKGSRTFEIYHKGVRCIETLPSKRICQS